MAPDKDHLGLPWEVNRASLEGRKWMQWLKELVESLPASIPSFCLVTSTMNLLV